MTVARGTSSCSNSRRFAASITENEATPVTFPAGEAIDEAVSDRIVGDSEDDRNGRAPLNGAWLGVHGNDPASVIDEA